MIGDNMNGHHVTITSAELNELAQIVSEKINQTDVSKSVQELTIQELGFEFKSHLKAAWPIIQKYFNHQPGVRHKQKQTIENDVRSAARSAQKNQELIIYTS